MTGRPMLLSYCTNVHPAEDLDGVIAQVERYAGPIRRAAGLDTLGVGLWLPATLAHQLDASATDRDRLRTVLAEQRLTVHTLNAFPYGGFHAEVVKLAVYTPTWADPTRAAYTLACARVLADLLPEGATGSISTLPLGWRESWTAEDDDAATAALAEVSAALRALPRTVRLAIEPEPGCILDTVDDVVDWLSARGDLIDPEYVGLCLDTCHLATSFADPVAAVRRVRDAGLRVVKIQASAALHVDDPADPVARAAVARFAERRYLHQTREQGPDGVLRVDDLPEALDTLPAAGPWRVHVHVPLHARPAAPLSATTQVLRSAVGAVARTPYGDEAHLDVETYTWAVLPEELAARAASDLVAGIAAELRWATEHLLPMDLWAADRPQRPVPVPDPDVTRVRRTA
ncbi:metabolite traffic protein EboE [Cellulomonas sp. NPDC089187]|uniref:metabolite traffic protein EboE n=1 Tax=Cellulomonas sp. NPDC089187 TaxID=3154970 RepID=UPI00342B0B3F